MNEFDNLIDWKVLNHQQNTPVPLSERLTQQQKSSKPESIPLTGHGEVQTIFGTFPADIPEFRYGTPEQEEYMKELVNAGVGSPGMKIAGRGIAAAKSLAKPYIEKGIEYMNPGKSAEAFRSTLGKGTSAENIEELSKRAKYASKSRETEALIPKAELYAQEGKSNIYEFGKGMTPETNIPAMAHMIAPGEKLGEKGASLLMSSIKKYRKNGNIESFIDDAEEIFGIKELGEKAVQKIEDTLLMPVKRESRYMADKEVSSIYSPKGKLMELHQNYIKKPTLENYDKLQSALKKEVREMEGRAKTSDTAVPKFEQLKANIKNLDADKEAFMGTLPEKMRNLETEFRTKYREFAETYKKGSKETGASRTLRRLAEGRSNLVTDEDVVKLFSHPTAADKRALADLGPDAAKNAIYAALQKVQPGDAKKMAETILDLKRTKGFDRVITPEMEMWSRNMLTRIGRVEKIKGISAAIPSALAGYGIAGFPGMAAGAVLPKGIKYARQLLRK